MNLYIEIENGQTKNHPAFENNLLDVFGEIPNNWQPFIRVQKPITTVYQIVENEQPNYKKVGETWMDVWVLRDMTSEEIIAKQEATKQLWALQENGFNFVNWIFDEVDCIFNPPIPRPVDSNKMFYWCGAENNWKEVPQYPEDEKQYKFDYANWGWIEIT